MISAWTDALRVRQWHKNLLVFVALVFSFSLDQPAPLEKAVLLFFAARPMALFFGNESAAWVIRGVAAVTLLRGMVSPWLSESRFQLNFGLIAAHELITVTALNALTMILCFVLRSVWAVVAGMIAAELIGVVTSYLLVRRWPSIRCRWQEVRELVNYGIWTNLSSIVLFVSTQFDSGLVGRFGGAIALGHYRMADNFSRSLYRELAGFLTTLTAPLYAKLQSDQERRKRMLLMSISLLAAVGFPFEALLHAGAVPFIRFLLGEKWLPIVPALHILVGAGMIILLQTTAGSIMYSMGYPKGDFQMNLVRAVILIAAGIPLTARYGAYGAAVASLVSSAAMIPVWFWFLRKFTGLRAGELWAELWLPLVSAVLLFGTLRGTMAVAHGLPDPIITALLIGQYLACLGLIALISHRRGQGNLWLLWR